MATTSHAVELPSVLVSPQDIGALQELIVQQTTTRLTRTGDALSLAFAGSRMPGVIGTLGSMFSLIRVLSIPGQRAFNAAKDELIGQARNAIKDQSHVISFLDKYNEKYNIPHGITEPSKDDLGAKFSRYLTARGIVVPGIGKLLTDFMREEVPELRDDAKVQQTAPPPPLPKKAPARWPKDRQGDESSVEFATRHYRVWMDAGVLTRQALKTIDPILFASVDNWLKHNRRKEHSDKLPDGFRLLTKTEESLTWASRVRGGKAPPPADISDARKLLNTLSRHGSKDGTQKKR